MGLAHKPRGSLRMSTPPFYPAAPCSLPLLALAASGLRLGSCCEGLSG